MNWEEFIRKAIFTPFMTKGRSYEGWDCWGLVYVGYRDVLDIALPTYTGEYNEVTDFKLLCKAFTTGAKGWDKSDGNPGSVALILRRNLPIHVGILTDKRNVLHCEQKVGTIQEPASNLRIEGYYEPAWI